ncbi:hypothetical protein QTO34_015003 [Cnephaeus nilssonii]|uniref:Uncharacterized protein n=1 Tax=Cnephaeus nilssonii TaxID=3371016 RepID=A0AA40LCV6_CNENI|nr:hypothetical protein QTO34_015003 [Eptesicus nilssonii]
MAVEAAAAGLRVAHDSKAEERKLKATQGTEVPIWSHLKKLTTEVQQIVKKQEAEATSSTMYLLMLASVSCQFSAKSCTAKSKDSE